MKRLCVLLVLFACGGDDDGAVDSGVDASFDSAVDSSFDAGGDSGSDATTDTGVDAGPETCDEEGAVRTAPCGNCGTGQERCEEGVWVLGACVGEGVCAPGALEVVPQAMCAEITRICTDACDWLEEETRAAGECEVDDARFVTEGCGLAERKPQTCSSECVWEDDGACESVCGALRDTPRLRSEVCIPSGDFVRGEMDLVSFGSFPEQTVTLTYAYAIDVYPITRAEYRRCVDAGECTVTAAARPLLEDPALQNAAWFVASFVDAENYCAWDGGRRLPTEAEWEKAMRGPAPRDNDWAFDGDTWPCADLPRPGCPNESEFEVYRDVGTMPATRSYYGVEDWEITSQWVTDFYSTDYHLDPSSLVDPAGPATGLSRVGKPSGTPRPDRLQIGGRTSGGVTSSRGFRCARDI